MVVKKCRLVREGALTDKAALEVPDSKPDLATEGLFE
jgi:hypothetical protein